MVLLTPKGAEQLRPTAQASRKPFGQGGDLIPSFRLGRMPFVILRRLLNGFAIDRHNDLLRDIGAKILGLRLSPRMQLGEIRAREGLDELEDLDTVGVFRNPCPVGVPLAVLIHCRPKLRIRALIGLVSPVGLGVASLRHETETPLRVALDPETDLASEAPVGIPVHEKRGGFGRVAVARGSGLGGGNNFEVRVHALLIGHTTQVCQQLFYGKRFRTRIKGIVGSEPKCPWSLPT